MQQILSYSPEVLKGFSEMAPQSHDSAPKAEECFSKSCSQETLEFLSSRDQFWLELCVLMHPAVIQAFCKKGVRITEALSLDQYV